MVIYYAANRAMPHRFPIGYTRMINGERCVLRRYTQAGHPQYVRPDGTFVTIRPGNVQNDRNKRGRVSRREYLARVRT